MKRDVKQEIADHLLAMLEEHGTDWVRPWASSRARNAESKRGYRGINILLTGAASCRNGFGSTYWHTYKGWQRMGHQVAKGQRGTSIVFWLKKEYKNEETGETKRVMFPKFYTVFNADQLDGKTFHEPEKTTTAVPLEDADSLVNATGADIRHGGDRAFYSPSFDHVQMPAMDDFGTTDGYYATLFHELGHWTGHKSRLDRDLSGWFGSPSYAFEELIAECCSAILCVTLGIIPEPRPDHAKYINGWITGIKDNPNAVIRAFSAAQKAADHIEKCETALDIAA